ncbi:hypothetical protein PRIC1_004868 [Phytophthora ramorum]
MPYGCITSNISQGSVGTVDVSTAVANAPNEACLSDSATGDGSARILELDDEPAAYVHAHTMDIDAKHNSKAIEISTKTVSEQLKVPAERVYVVLSVTGAPTVLRSSRLSNRFRGFSEIIHNMAIVEDSVQVTLGKKKEVVPP